MKKSLYIVVFLTLLFYTASVSTAASLPAPGYVSAFVYSSGIIRVSWDNNVSGATGFTIQRKIDNGGFITLANVSSGTSAYNDTGISNGHRYSYRVYATRGSTFGESSDSFAVEYLYPSGLTTKGITDTEIELTWTYPYSNSIPETNYHTVIERRTEGSSTWQTVDTVPGSQKYYTDKGLSEATRYYYRIRAVTATSAIYLYYPNNSTGQSAISLLKAPTNVTAQVISTQSVKISWDDVSSKETGYRIERKTGNGSFASLGSVTSGHTSYVDSSVVNGEQYTYRVTAVSPSVQGTPGMEITVPFLFPVSFEIKDAYSTQMTLSWGYPGSGNISPDNSRVMIERRETSATDWEQIHITRPGETEYTDSGLTPGTRYYYRIRSRYNDDFTTEYFPSAYGISEYTRLLLDTHFYAYALSNREIRLEWDEEAVGSFNITLEKLDSGGMFERFATLNRTGSYIDTVSPGSTHTYRMKISSSLMDSGYTQEIEVTAEPLPPVKNPVVKGVMPERIFLTWEYDRAVESGFEVWRKDGTEGIWKLIGTTRQGQCMFSDQNITDGESYTYRIRAMKSNTIFSEFSDTETVNVSFPAPDGQLVISRSGNMLYLGWDDFSEMEEYYAIEYKTSVNDDWHVLDNIRGIVIYRFIPQPGTDYTIRVRAVSKLPVYESYSNEVFYSTKIPAAPAYLDTNMVGPNRVVLRWTDLSDNESEFVICRKNTASDDSYEIIGTTGENISTFSDTGVVPNQSYTYVVRSKNAAGQSFDSNEITVATPEYKQFIDLGTHPWAMNAIEALVSMGVVDGDGKGHFNPAGTITRAEFIKLLVGTFSFQEYSVGSFEDVSPDDWYHRWVMTAYRHKIVEPDENGLFHPNTPITRQDIVYYSLRAISAAGLNLEQPPLYVLYTFDDYYRISPYAQSAFAAMYKAGIINGIGNNLLGPENTATRAEAATIVHRMVQALGKAAEAD